MDDDLFNRILNTESVFRKEGQKTLAQAWVPDQNQKLMKRDNEIKKLLTIHRPIIETDGAFSANTLILGKGGIGKTLTTRYFGRKFRDAALKRNKKLIIEYYDCLQHRTKSSILRNISEKLSFSSGHGYSDNEILQQILRKVRDNNQYLLIILDEIHNIPSDDILALFNASISFGETNSRFCIIGISRISDWYKVENEKISSRVQETIKMDPYNKEEAFEILKYRRMLAFREGVLEDEVLELIADIVSSTKNMRTGIDIIRSCGLRADEQSISTIPAEMVLESRNEINPTFRADVIDNLKKHEKMALLAIARTLNNTGEPFTMVDDAFENYEIVCEELGSKPHVKMSFRKYVRSLRDLKALESEYLNPTTDKKGRQLKVWLNDINSEKLIELLEKILLIRHD